MLFLPAEKKNVVIRYRIIEIDSMETAKLLLHCPDRPGILAEVTDFITVNKGNIVYLITGESFAVSRVQIVNARRQITAYLEED